MGTQYVLKNGDKYVSSVYQHGMQHSHRTIDGCRTALKNGGWLRGGADGWVRDINHPDVDRDLRPTVDNVNWVPVCEAITPWHKFIEYTDDLEHAKVWKTSNRPMETIALNTHLNLKLVAVKEVITRTIEEV